MKQILFLFVYFLICVFFAIMYISFLWLICDCTDWLLIQLFENVNYFHLFLYSNIFIIFLHVLDV